MNKSLATNLSATLLIIIGYISPIHNQIILATGAFALSGAITNWLAIHMLFEKIPFLYGSGVIPNRFEDFKLGMKTLIIEEFFNKAHIEKFFQDNGSSLSAEKLNEKIDFNKIFEGLVDAIIESPMGSMLGMLGGRDALTPLKDPIIDKLKGIMNEFTAKETNPTSDFAQNVMQKIEKIIDNRLSDLTPEMVKNIIQKMIRKHLGWLVVWGGVFGGLIGFIFSFIN